MTSRKNVKHIFIKILAGSKSSAWLHLTRKRNKQWTLPNISNWSSITKALSIRWKIPVSISGSFQWRMKQHCSEFPEKRTTLRRNLRKSLQYQEFPSHLTFFLEFWDFLIEWFAFRKFNNFRIFWKLSQEISAPFVPVRRISDCLFEWKSPLVSDLKEYGILAEFSFSTRSTTHFFPTWPHYTKNIYLKTSLITSSRLHTFQN